MMLNDIQMWDLIAGGAISGIKADARPDSIPFGISRMGFVLSADNKSYELSNSYAEGTKDIKRNTSQIWDFYSSALDMPDSAYINAGGMGRFYSREAFDLPQDVYGIVMPLDIYTDAGLMLAPSCLPPGYKGRVRLTMTNHTPVTVKVYLGAEGIARLCLFRCSAAVGEHTK